MLRDLFKKLLSQAKTQDVAGDLPVGTLTFATPYPQTRYADVDGIGQVEIDFTGNMIGFSPVERCTAGGETAWIPTELCKNLRLQPFTTWASAGTPAGSNR